MLMTYRITIENSSGIYCVDDQTSRRCSMQYVDVVSSPLLPGLVPPLQQCGHKMTRRHTRATHSYPYCLFISHLGEEGKLCACCTDYFSLTPPVHFHQHCKSFLNGLWAHSDHSTATAKGRYLSLALASPPLSPTCCVSLKLVVLFFVCCDKRAQHTLSFLHIQCASVSVMQSHTLLCTVTMWSLRGEKCRGGQQIHQGNQKTGRTVVAVLGLHMALAPSVGRISQMPTSIALSASAQLGADRLSCSLKSLYNSCSVSGHIQSDYDVPSSLQWRGRGQFLGGNI